MKLQPVLATFTAAALLSFYSLPVRAADPTEKTPSPWPNAAPPSSRRMARTR